MVDEVTLSLMEEINSRSGGVRGIRGERQFFEGFPISDWVGAVASLFVGQTGYCGARIEMRREIVLHNAKFLKHVEDKIGGCNTFLYFNFGFMAKIYYTLCPIHSSRSPGRRSITGTLPSLASRLLLHGRMPRMQSLVRSVRGYWNAYWNRTTDYVFLHGASQIYIGEPFQDLAPEPSTCVSSFTVRIWFYGSCFFNLYPSFSSMYTCSGGFPCRSEWSWRAASLRQSLLHGYCASHAHTGTGGWW